MALRKIETAREFFDHVVRKDVDDLLANQTDLRTAYHACGSLLSLRDWVVESHKGQGWTSAGTPQSIISGKPGLLQPALEAIEPKVAIVTDIANASKHMILNPALRRTNLCGNANTSVTSVRGEIGAALVGAVPLGGSIDRIEVKIDNSFYDVVNCVRAVRDMWKKLFAENGW